MSFTLIIIAITAVISIIAFNNHELFSRLQFNAYQVYHKKQYYRLISHGFVHAGWWHLFVNMLVLYFFGPTVEAYLLQMASMGLIKFPILIFLAFYLLYLTSRHFSSPACVSVRMTFGRKSGFVSESRVPEVLDRCAKWCECQRDRVPLGECRIQERFPRRRLRQIEIGFGERADMILI